jgi:hypothetical protein|nr:MULTISPECIES: hypothetical protein [unclassified Blastomonas]
MAIPRTPATSVFAATGNLNKPSVGIRAGYSGRPSDLGDAKPAGFNLAIESGLPHAEILQEILHRHQFWQTHIFSIDIDADSQIGPARRG